jgi:hypothetical protein
MGFILPQFSKICPPPAQVYLCNGALICPSTAYEGAWTLYTRPIWMWDAVSGGLQPQPWHHSTFGLCLTPIFQNLAPTCTCITVWGCTHMPIHSIWRCSITFYTSNMDVGYSKWWFTASTMTPQHHMGFTLPQFSKIWPPTCTGITM